MQEADMLIRVLLMHEDLATGLRAKRVLDHLEDKIGMKPRFVVNLWKFDMLNDVELKERAVVEAGQADILFLSLHGNGNLSESVRQWLSRWIEIKEKGPSALLVSFDLQMRDSASANAILAHLKELAAPAGIDVFPHFGARPNSARDWTFQDVRPTIAVQPVLQVKEPRVAWGINE